MTIIHRSIVSPAVQDVPIVEQVFRAMPAAFLRRVERHVFTAHGLRFLAWQEMSGLYNLKNVTHNRTSSAMTAEEFDALIAALVGSPEKMDPQWAYLVTAPWPGYGGESQSVPRIRTQASQAVLRTGPWVGGDPVGGGTTRWPPCPDTSRERRRAAASRRCYEAREVAAWNAFVEDYRRHVQDRAALRGPEGE